MAAERKVALVTGSASGIGRAEALALARAGYDVVINYSQSEGAARDTAAQAEAAGARTLVYQCDVADEAQVRRMVAATEERFGRLDVLINNAGTTVKERALYEKAIPSGLKPDPIPNIQSIVDDQEWYIAHGHQQERVDVRSLIDTSMVEEAIRQLGPAGR